jgi:hypothetical protein
MSQIKDVVNQLIDFLSEHRQGYGLVILGAAALIILLPLAWYQRRLLRKLIGLPPRRVREEPKLEEDLARLVPTSSLQRTRRLFVQGVPARLQLAVLAPLGKGATLEASATDEMLNQVRWGLGTIARQDQAAIRIWPLQLSAHAFPAVFHRHMHKGEPDDQPSHWVLVAGQTPRPRSVLIGLALWTDEATTIGRLSVDASQWMHTLHVEAIETQGTRETLGPPQHSSRAPAEGQAEPDLSPPLSETEGRQSLPKLADE